MFLPMMFDFFRLLDVQSRDLWLRPRRMLLRVGGFSPGGLIAKEDRLIS